MANDNKNGGFSALELFAIVVIFGILIVTSIPMFVSLKEHDYYLSMQRTKSAVEGALKLTHMRAVSENIHEGHKVLKSGSLEISLYNGYPVVSDIDSLQSIFFWEDAEVEYRAFPKENKIAIVPLKVKQQQQIIKPEDYNCVVVYENGKNGASVKLLNLKECKGDF